MRQPQWRPVAAVAVLSSITYEAATRAEAATHCCLLGQLMAARAHHNNYCTHQPPSHRSKREFIMYLIYASISIYSL